MGTWSRRAAAAAAVGTVLAAAAAAQTAAVDEKTQAAYLKARDQLGVNPVNGAVTSANSLGAKPVKGEVVGNAGRRVIVACGAGWVSVQLRDPTFPKVGEEVSYTARENGTFSWRGPAGKRRKLPDYKDVTVSLGEFLQYRGGLAPEPRKMPSGFQRRESGISGR